MVKKLKLILLVTVLVLYVYAGQSLARTSNVSATIHNLSSDFDTVNSPGWSSPYATNEEEVCVFCHTPHGGSTSNPLWNRQNPGAGTFTHYTSATLTSVINSNSSRNVSNESLACLSCHDGSIATNRVLNPSNNNPTGQPLPEFGSDVPMISGFDPFIGAIPGPRIGGSLVDVNSTGDLSDDHPISFSYVDVYTEDASGLKDPSVLELDASPDRVRFFGADASTAGGMRVECSSCHDPHVDQYDPVWNPTGDAVYRPFLVMDNSGSALCLSCHVK